MEHARRRGLILKLGYGAGYLPDPCFYQFLASFQIVFLTAVVGMSPSRAGTVYSVTMLADAVFSLFIGKFSDNLRSRFGRRRPFLLFTTLAMPLSFAMMFRTVEGGEAFRMAYYTAFGFLFWVAYAVFFVCYVALGADVATDYEDRIILNSFTRLFTIGGGILGTAVPLSAIAAMEKSGMDTSSSWFAVAAMLAGVVFLGSLWCWNVTRGCERPVFERPESQGLRSFASDCMQLLRIRPYRKIIFAKIMSNFAYTMYTGALIFYIVYVLGADETFSTAVYLLSNMASLVLVPFIARMTLKFGKRRYMSLSQFASAAAMVLLCAFGVKSKALLVVYMMVYNFAQASFWQINNTNFYDITDLDEYRFGVRREGNIMALQAFIGTVMTAGMLKLLTGLLEISDFDAAAAAQPAGAEGMLKVIFLILPAAGTLLTGYFMLTYRVGKSGYALLQEALYRRHHDMDPLPADEVAQIEDMFR